MASRGANVVLSRANRMRQTQQSSLEAGVLEIEDVSYRHAGHAGVKGDATETHFKVKIVSSKFEGQSLVKRHRIIYDLLADELKTGLHALSIVAYTPKETKECDICFCFEQQPHSPDKTDVFWQFEADVFWKIEEGTKIRVNGKSLFVEWQGCHYINMRVADLVERWDDSKLVQTFREEKTLTIKNTVASTKQIAGMKDRLIWGKTNTGVHLVKERYRKMVNMVPRIDLTWEDTSGT